MTDSQYSPARDQVRAMFSSIASRYDLANSVLSFGLHHWWKRRLLAHLSEAQEGVVLDLCTGTADLIPLISRRTSSQVVGVDFCLPMLRQGKGKLPAGTCLVHGDGLSLPIQSDSVTAVTVAFGVRNFEDLSAGLQEIRRVLVSGGRLLILEFGQPQVAWWRSLYQFYSAHLLPRIGAMITGNAFAYEYLPETSAAFPCQERFVQILAQEGFQEISYRSFLGGICYSYFAEKPSFEGEA